MTKRKRHIGTPKQPFCITVLAVADFIRNYPNSWLSIIAEKLGINKGSVHKALELLRPMLVITGDDNAEGMPRLPRCYMLKRGVTNERIERWLKVKTSVRGL